MVMLDVLLLTYPIKLMRFPPCHKSCLVKFFLLGYLVTKSLDIGDILFTVFWYFVMCQENIAFPPFTLFTTTCYRHPNSLVNLSLS